MMAHGRAIMIVWDLLEHFATENHSACINKQTVGYFFFGINHVLQSFLAL
jgi:hypothetical protein